MSMIDIIIFIVGLLWLFLLFLEHGVFPFTRSPEEPESTEDKA